MSRPLRLTSAAKRDVFDARYWYLEQAPEIDEQFREDLSATMRRIEERPEMYPVVHQDVHRGNLRRFPYAVLYRIQPQGIQVIGVVHHARDPRRWKRRR